MQFTYRQINILIKGKTWQVKNIESSNRPLNVMTVGFPRGGGGGVFSGVHKLVVKIKKNTPKALILGQKSTHLKKKR